MRPCKLCSSDIGSRPVRAKFCSSGCKQKFNNSRSMWRYRNTQKAIQRKLDLISSAGGRCQLCGYNKNLSALAFHHRDPLKKTFTLGMDALFFRSMKAIRAEAAGCDLLCHNCHAETHHPNYEMVLVLGVEPSPGSNLERSEV